MFDFGMYPSRACQYWRANGNIDEIHNGQWLSTFLFSLFSSSSFTFRWLCFICRSFTSEITNIATSHFCKKKKPFRYHLHKENQIVLQIQFKIQWTNTKKRPLHLQLWTCPFDIICSVNHRFHAQQIKLVGNKMVFFFKAFRSIVVIGRSAKIRLHVNNKKRYWYTLRISCNAITLRLTAKQNQKGEAANQNVTYY